MSDDASSIPGFFASHRKKVFWCTLAVVVVYFVVKVILYEWYWTDPMPTGQAIKVAVAEAATHMDPLGYILAVLGVLITLVLTAKIDQQTTGRLESLQKVNADITDNLRRLAKTSEVIAKSTANLEDANRKVLNTLPEIIDEAIAAVHRAQKDSDRLLIMNYTSKLGVIHSYNRRFVQQLAMETQPASLDGPQAELAFAASVTRLNQKIAHLDAGIVQSAMNAGMFHMVTLDEGAFRTQFIEKYFDTEMRTNSANLFFYEGGRIVTPGCIKQGLPDMQTKITDSVLNQNEEAIRRLTVGKQLVTRLPSIPYQMFLVEYWKDDRPAYESLIIYAVDEVLRSGVKQRNIIAISSTSQQLFVAFETLFNDVKGQSNMRNQSPMQLSTNPTS